MIVHFLFLILCPFFLVSLGGCLLIFIDLFKEPVFGFSHFHHCSQITHGPKNKQKVRKGSEMSENESTTYHL